MKIKMTGSSIDTKMKERSDDDELKSVEELQNYVKDQLAESGRVREEIVSLCKYIKELSKSGNSDTLNHSIEELKDKFSKVVDQSQLTQRQTEDVISEIPWNEIYESGNKNIAQELLLLIKSFYESRINDLKKISLVGCRMSDTMVHELVQATFSNLVELNLSECDAIRNIHPMIQSCGAIQILNLGGTSISSINSEDGECLRALIDLDVSNCKELRELNLRSCSRIEKLIAKDCIKLNKLDLAQDAKLETLDIQRSELSIFSNETNSIDHKEKYQRTLQYRNNCILYADESQITKKQVDDALMWLDQVNLELDYPGILPPSFALHLDCEETKKGRNPAKCLLRVLCGLGYMPTLPYNVVCIHSETQNLGRILKYAGNDLWTRTTILHEAVKFSLTDIISVLIMYFSWLLNVRDCDGLLPVEFALILKCKENVINLMVDLESNVRNAVVKSGKISK